MTTAYAARDSIVENLKNVYGDGMTNQFPDEKITYNLFSKSDRKPGGNGYIGAVRYARAQGTGARAESKYLPDPLTGVKDQFTVTPKYIYGSIRITGPAIESAKGNPMSFVDSLSDEIEDIYQSILVDMNRMSHWDGHGQLGRLSAAATVPADTWAGTFDNDIGVQYMIEGQLVDFYASAGDTVPGSSGSAVFGQRILRITPSTNVVIFETNATTYKATHPTLSTLTNGVATTMSNGAIAVKLGARDLSWASTDTPVEFFGLDGIFDDGTNLAVFEGITVASNPKWAANVLSNSSVNRELSVDLMLEACDISRKRGGGKIDKILMGMGQRRKYANLFMSDVRFAPEVLKGGYRTLTFGAGDGSIEMVIDPMCQPNRLYFFPNDVIKKYELTPLGWGNLDGSQLHQKAQYDEWDAFLRIYTQLGVEQRNTLCVLKDLTEPNWD